jgi:hypothetical protein
LQEQLSKCWLIQSVFPKDCAKEEEDSQMHFRISLFWAAFAFWGLEWLQGRSVKVANSR